MIRHALPEDCVVLDDEHLGHLPGIIVGEIDDRGGASVMNW
jgi:hypothetical protein